MHWLQHTFQTYPELAIFLTLSIGFYIGSLHFGKFSLGTVTSVLLTGILIGQMNIAISPNVKSVFFLMFLFTVGYSVGPQFFRGLKKDGLPQMLFAVIMCSVCLLINWAIAVIMHYNKGQAAGLLAGSQTVSAIIGVASGTIDKLNSLNADQKQNMINAIPVCYAVTYIFGTAGSAWLLSSIGPKLLGGLDKVKAQCRELEEKLGNDPTSAPGMRSALNTTSFNAFRVSLNSIECNKTVRQVEQEFLSRNHRLFVKKVRQNGEIVDATPDLEIHEGDTIVLNGRREFMLPESDLGEEVADNELLNFPVGNITVYVTKNESVGLTLKELALKDYAYGVIIQSILRAGIKMPIYPGTKIEKGDQLELVGLKKDIERAAEHIGYGEVPTEKTNMVFVGLGIVVGGLVGSLTLNIGNVPLSLSTSGGALFSGLFFGWLRSQYPTFGKIPEPAVWIMNNLGLCVFISVVGITSGPKFVSGLKEMGLSIFFAGIIASSVPILAGILMGRYLFKFHPAYTLGCTAGARTSTAALPAIQEALDSNLPTLGYTVTYAVGCMLLIIWGIVMVLII